MAIIFQDTFTEAFNTTLTSHTPDTGTSWSVLIQAFQGDETLHVRAIADDVEKESGSLSDGVLYTADATYSTANYGAEMQMGLTDTGDDYHIIAVRIQDSNNMYALEFNTDRFLLYKKTTASGWQTISSDLGSDIVADNDVVRLEIGGSVIQALVNGVIKLQVTDTSHSSAGKAGYGIGSVITSGADMSLQRGDNFEVNDDALATTTSTTTSTSTTTTSTSTTRTTSTSTSTTRTTTSTTTSTTISTTTSTSTTTTSTSTTRSTSTSTSTTQTTSTTRSTSTSTTMTGTTTSTTTTQTTTSTTTSTTTTTTLATSDKPEIVVDNQGPYLNLQE